MPSPKSNIIDPFTKRRRQECSSSSGTEQVWDRDHSLHYGEYSKVARMSSLK